MGVGLSLATWEIGYSSAGRQTPRSVIMTLSFDISEPDRRSPGGMYFLPIARHFCPRSAKLSKLLVRKSGKYYDSHEKHGNKATFSEMSQQKAASATLDEL